jgi:hypothetical protein
VGDDTSPEAKRVGELTASIGGLFGAPVLQVGAYLPETRRRKSSPSSWKLKMGSTVSPPASRVNTSILPCIRVAISQNDLQAALFFGTFATSYAGTVIADERTVPHEAESSTEDWASLP